MTNVRITLRCVKEVSHSASDYELLPECPRRSVWTVRRLVALLALACRRNQWIIESFEASFIGGAHRAGQRTIYDSVRHAADIRWYPERPSECCILLTASQAAVGLFSSRTALHISQSTRKRFLFAPKLRQWFTHSCVTSVDLVSRSSTKQSPECAKTHRHG